MSPTRKHRIILPLPSARRLLLVSGELYRRLGIFEYNKGVEDDYRQSTIFKGNKGVSCRIKLLNTPCYSSLPESHLNIFRLCSLVDLLSEEVGCSYTLHPPLAPSNRRRLSFPFRSYCCVCI